MEKITTHSAKETQEIGIELAKQVLQKKISKQALALTLQGDLGAGKTTFLQGFAKGLGIKEKVLSPTFILMKKFQIPSSKTKTKLIPQTPKLRSLWYKRFYHIDCYRLKDEKDLEHLGFKEIISNPENIVAIEWPKRIEKILPKSLISIKFKHLKENKRKLTIRQ